MNKGFSNTLLNTNLLSRRKFIKKAGLVAISTGLVPSFISCDDDEKKFYFAVLSDTHIYSNTDNSTNQIMALTTDILNNYEVPLDFVTITGDLCDYVDLSDGYENSGLYNLVNYLSKFNMPVYPCMGNHDYYEIAFPGWIEDLSGRQEREQLYIDKGVMKAAYYKKSVNNVAFYMLNSHQKDDEIDWDPELVGHIGRTQLDWLKEGLTDGQPSFFFHHVPLATPIAASYNVIPFEIPNEAAGISKYTVLEPKNYTDPYYTEVLDVYNSQIKGVFVGHTHAFVKEEYNGIPTIMTDAFKGERSYDDISAPYRFHIVECSANTGKFNIYNESYIIYNPDPATVYQRKKMEEYIL